MFSWTKSNHLRKSIREDKRHLKGRALRFLRSYLSADPNQKHQFYEAVQGASDACRPDIKDVILDSPEMAASTANLASKVVIRREKGVAKGDLATAEFITDAYATVALAFRRAAGAYNSDPKMQQLGTAAVHLLTIATSFMTARQADNMHEEAGFS
jgi:hypothetical protein